MENDKQKVLFILSTMKGGGAERVISLLANEFKRNGMDVRVLLTSCAPGEAYGTDLDDQIPLLYLDQIAHEPVNFLMKNILAIGRAVSSLFCHLFEGLNKRVPASLAYLSFWSRNRTQIKQLESVIREDPDESIIAFLLPSIPMTILAAKSLHNKVIISERGNPYRFLNKRYGWNFVKKYYPRADAAVFQTNDAKNAYPPCVSDKGTVICNPVKSDLPEPYTGERNHNITTFCRISAQKNLPLLFEAFKRLHDDHPDYILRVIGDAATDEGQAVKKQLDAFISENRLQDAVVFEPFNANVHDGILQDAMYVNSSDYEGISNAMLEAMAIGLPVVCTDCPIGGANATIRDGENGLLVPVGDSEALYRAMKRVIEEPGLADKLSRNAVTLREELKLENIARKWMDLL